MCEESLKNSMFFFRFGKCATVAHTFLTNAETNQFIMQSVSIPFPETKETHPFLTRPG